MNSLKKEGTGGSYSFRKINRLRPWTRGSTIIAIKPKSRLSQCYLNYLALRRNRIIIDIIDLDVHYYPKKNSNFEFIATDGMNAMLISKFYPDKKVWRIPHHVNVIPSIPENKSTAVCYVGYDKKSTFPASMEIKVLSFQGFVENPENSIFHWCIKKSHRFCEPETKIAFAAAHGAIAIVNQWSLGYTVPLNYPFFLKEDFEESDLQELKVKMQVKTQKDYARACMKEVRMMTELSAVSKKYKRLIFNKEDESLY